MKDLKLPSKDQILKAADKCPQAKDALKELFPEAFESEWKNVSSEIEVRTDSFGGGAGLFIELFWKNNHSGFFSLNAHRGRIEFFPGSLSDCTTHTFKVEGNNDVFKFYARENDTHRKNQKI